MPETKSDRNKNAKEVVNVADKEKDKSRKVNNVKRNKKRSSSTASDSSTSSTSSSSSNTSSGSSSGSSSSSSSSSSNSSSSRSSSPSPPKKVRTEKKVVKKPEVKKVEPKENRIDNQSKYREKPKSHKPADAPVVPLSTTTASSKESKPIKMDKIKHDKPEKSEQNVPKEVDTVVHKSVEKPLVEKVSEKPVKVEEKIPKKSNKIHLTKLTRNITMAHLKEIFSTWGSIKHIDMPSDRFHPEFNRGFAYIEFDESCSAQQAIAEMHNGQLDGQEISVIEVPLPRVDHSSDRDRDRMRRSSRDRIPDNHRRFRSPRRHVRSPIRQRSPPPARRNSAQRRSPFRRRAIRSPPRRRRPIDSPSRDRPRRRSRSPLSPSRRNGKERVERKSPVTRRRSKSSTSRSR